MIAPPKECGACGHYANRVCSRFQIAAKATGKACAFAKSRMVPKPDQGTML